MRAAVYRGVNDVRVESVPVPRIGPNELLVRVAVCGVCPTDIKKIQSGAPAPPRIFGHETAGTIVKLGVGSSKLGFKAGDRVALHHHVPCLQCHFCRHRAFAQCPQYRRTGITAGFEPAGGGFAEYVRVMDFALPGLVKIPAKNSFEEGALLEPVNTVLKAIHRLNLLRGDRVLVAGQGPIGLMFTRLLKLRGARVLATDLLASRLRLARRWGAEWTKLVPSSKLEVPNPKFGERRGAGGRLGFGPGTLDAAIIAVPSDEATRQALRAVRGGGQVLLFAHTRHGGTLGIDPAAICMEEKDLLGSYSADLTLQAEAARLVFSRRLNARHLITHRFPLEQAPAAIALAARPADDSLKIVVEPQSG
ncbi:MAG: alcohol dehydrogenase catalytic domain-containing protein [Verrucomicrobiota bacterium]|nr:alcohol dehydrogenase catalytic domain-containing protein [Verrucomicrobiota bacterium]